MQCLESTLLTSRNVIYRVLIDRRVCFSLYSSYYNEDFLRNFSCDASKLSHWTPSPALHHCVLMHANVYSLTAKIKKVSIQLHLMSILNPFQSTCNSCRVSTLNTLPCFTATQCVWRELQLTWPLNNTNSVYMLYKLWTTLLGRTLNI